MKPKNFLIRGNPCELCGNNVTYWYENESNFHVVIECENIKCGAGAKGRTAEEAKKHWNELIKEVTEDFKFFEQIKIQ